MKCSLLPDDRAHPSATAGAFAALAGVCGKFGADGETNALQYISTLCQTLSLAGTSIEVCRMLEMLLRVLSIALMLGCNAMMLNYFVKGLHETDSLTATITSAAVNFMLSAAFGHFFFQEHLPMQWFFGATIILVGMGFLLHGDSSSMLSTSAPSPKTTKTKQQ